MSNDGTSPETGPARTIGLVGATGVGVGAIVGGGILVLAGVAFRAAGPGAIAAFAVNGFIAVLTALSFAEMSTAFPESGGAYTFAKKVLSVRAAFTVGWILWFAYIVAAVLYALGFASYAVPVIAEAWRATGSAPPEWLGARTVAVSLALAASTVYTVSLIRKATGGGEWATWGKVVVFAVLIVAGLWALAKNDTTDVAGSFTPFLPRGSTGLLEAMGFTFIALQGFDLIAAVAGEVKNPEKTIPRAMLLSLGAAIVIYLPLLFIVATVGVTPGSDITAMSTANPETVMALAVRNYMGAPGYWLVVVAAILSTLSALQANLLAASRVALTMATDRTLPAVIGQIHPRRNTPLMAIYATALALTAILLMVPDLAAAGAAASLIFLVAFALAHWTAILARRRSSDRTSVVSTAVPKPPAYRTPWFPLVPITGGLACAGMAVFQAVAVPAAGGITAVWLGLGVLLYFALFSSRAQTFDAFAEAHDPSLARLRGRNPTVLVPIANPASAAAMVGIAAALAPPRVGRVMLLSVIRPPDDREEESGPRSIDATQGLLREALTTCFRAGHRPEALMTVADAPWSEIGRVASAQRCEGLLLGLGEATERIAGGHLETLLNEVECDVMFLRTPANWTPRQARRVLVPLAGRGEQFEVRARLLGSLVRTGLTDITWITVVPEGAPEHREVEARRTLERVAADQSHARSSVEVVRSDDAAGAIADRADDHDLLVIGLQKDQEGRRVFGSFAAKIAAGTSSAILFISRR